MNRMISETERSIVKSVADSLPPDQRARLLGDLAIATVAHATPDNAVLTFELSGYQRPHGSGQRSFGIQNELLDRDGAQLSFDLYADENGRLYIFELIRWDNGNVIAPDWSTVQA